MKPTVVKLILNAPAFAKSIMLAASASAHKTLLNLTKADVGLANVDNTADAAKPVSTAQQTVIDAKIGGSVGATTNRLVKSSGTGGLTLQSTGITVDASNNLSGAAAIRADGFGGTTTTLNVGELNATTLIFFVTSSSAKWRIDQTAGSNVGSLNPSGTRHIGDLTPVQSIACVTLNLTGALNLAAITKAALLALTPTGATAGRWRVTDATPANREAYPDGTNWRYTSDDVVVT